jgi:FKBP-type peptidyl-prolyl cis-trans isomerase FkpA
MIRPASLALAALLAFPALGADLKTDEQKTLYALGLAIARDVAPFGLSRAELEFVKQGLTDAVTGKKPAVDLAEYNPKIAQLANARSTAQAQGFLDKAAKEKGAAKSDSGLLFTSLQEGSGASPKDTDTVKVHYRGTLPDGKEFDSSYKRNQPAEFPLNGVIKCWTEGLQKMKVGGKAKLVCPPAIAYGPGGRPPVIPPNAVLVFEVELLEIVKK